MNKKTKGVVAGAAGAAILLGTAGTFALWQVEREMAGAEVTGGVFSLSADELTWVETNLAGDVLAENVDGEIQLVPDVVLRGTSTNGVALAGEHLVAQLTTQAGEPAPEWLDVTWSLGDETLEGDSVVLRPGATANRALSVAIQLADQSGDENGSTVADEEPWLSGDFVITLQQLAPGTAAS